MPWKGEKDPYKVWLSEIILQQTRVEQGLPYYQKFILKYPTIKKLAAAKDEEVFKLWEGLGYYSRCRNLLHTARYISNELQGKFPDTFSEIVKLKGVGDYTASAIASFCFNLPYAVVDGNVIRVHARYYGINKNSSTSEGKKYFEKIALQNLSKKKPGVYNQAIMDFGATVCKPLAPLCGSCSLRKDCIAYRKNKTSAYPVKNKISDKKERWFNYFIFNYRNKTFIRQRKSNDIWKDLYEYYLYETEKDVLWDETNLSKFMAEHFGLTSPYGFSFFKARPQQLTHQKVYGYMIEIDLPKIPKWLQKQPGKWLSNEEIQEKAFPRFITEHLRFT